MTGDDLFGKNKKRKGTRRLISRFDVPFMDQHVISVHKDFIKEVNLVKSNMLKKGVIIGNPGATLLLTQKMRKHEVAQRKKRGRKR